MWELEDNLTSQMIDSNMILHPPSGLKYTQKSQNRAYIEEIFLLNPHRLFKEKSHNMNVTAFWDIASCSLVKVPDVSEVRTAY
jgi:hypothetical protein